MFDMSSAEEGTDMVEGTRRVRPTAYLLPYLMLPL